MKVEYFYCPWCGFEDNDIEVGFSATYANGDFYICPECKRESSHVEEEE